MSKYWTDVVHNLTPYVPGEQPKEHLLIKLNTNENPYGPSQKVIESIAAANNDQLRLYPDPESDALKSTLASYYKISKNSIFIGNGSDEVLAFIFQAFFKKDLPLLFPDITYSFYPVYSRLYGIEYKTIPLDDEFNIRSDDYIAQNGGIIFPNPNAPTGIPKNLKDIETILKLNQESVVVIDEAYVDFGTESSVNLINQYDNLIVTQSFSKSRSLAGMRIGFAIASEELIEALTRIKNSFNSYPIDRLAQMAGVAAIEDVTYFNETCSSIIKARTFLEKELSEIGFDTLPSGANFIFTKHRVFDAITIFSKLRSQGVLVRHFNNPERISQYLRITIGSMEQMRKLVFLLKEIVGYI